MDRSLHALRRSWRGCLAAAIVALGVWPAVAGAATPAVATMNALQTGATTLTLQGFVGAGSVATSWFFAYAPSSSTFCTSFGASGPATDTATQTTTATGPVSAAVSGLTAGVAYCYVLTAGQGGAPVTGGVMTATPGLPTAQTEFAGSTGGGTATVSGEVDPSGQATSYAVAYGPDDSPWCMSAGASGTPPQTSASQSLDPSAVGPQDVSVDLSGLVSGTEYCAALVASNGSGAGTGATLEFLDGAPGAVLLSTPTTADTTAVIEGQIDPADQHTSYAVEYDTAGSDWCQSDGLDGVPQLTTATTLGASAGPTAVEVDLSGLASGTGYCAELLAINDSASASSVMQTFTTTGTAAATLPVTTSTTTTTAAPTKTTTTTTTAAPTKTTTTTSTTAKPSKPARKTTTTTTTASGARVGTGATAPTGTSSSTRAGASVYAIAVGRTRAAHAVEVRVPKTGALRLRLTSSRSSRVRVTVRVSVAAGRHSRSLRVVHVSIRPHTTSTISVRISRAARRALGGGRTVRVTTTAR